MTTVDDAVEAGARALTESEYGEGPNDLQVADLVVTAAWPILSAGLRGLHTKGTSYEHEDGCPDTSDEHRQERHREDVENAGEYYCLDLPLHHVCINCPDGDGLMVDWPCATVRELDRIDKELGND